MPLFRNISVRHKLILCTMLPGCAALLLTCAAVVTCDVIPFREKLADTPSHPAAHAAAHAPAVGSNSGEIGTAVAPSDLQELYALHARVRRDAAVLAGVAVAALAVTFLLALGLQRVIAGPIEHLAEAA